MTIATTTNKAIGLGNGVSTNWPFLFLIPLASQLYVYYTDAVGSITTIPAGDYSVAGIGNPAGGSVTYPLVGSPIATGTSLTVYRQVPYQQLTDVTNQGGFYPEVYEAALDYITMEIQQLAEIQTRSLVLPVSTQGVSVTLPAPRANYGLGWNSTGTALTNITLSGTIAVPIQVTDGGTGATSAAAARANLGAAASGANTDITSLYLNNTGLKVKDTDASHGLTLKPGSNLTADRTLTLTTGDADRTLTLGGDTTLNGGTHSGTNTGDQWRNRLLNSGFAVDQRVNSATARADDVYGLDRWYTLTQTATIQISQQAAQEAGTPFNIRLNQNQAAAQRMGVAQIIEGKNCKDLRGQGTVFGARVRCSAAQALRYAVLEWTGTEDAVTSDVVLDWTSAVYTPNNFFLAANLNVLAVGAITPGAATWTDLTALAATVGASANNLIIFVWTEGTAAQNVTLDVGRANYTKGAAAPVWEPLSFTADLAECQRYYAKTYNQDVAPAAVSALGAFTLLCNAAGSGIGTWCFPVHMRATPTVTLYNATTGAAGTWRSSAGADPAVTVDGAGMSGVSSFMNGTGGAGVLCRGHGVADAEL